MTRHGVIKNMKFIADEMLGKLAKWLRLIGCDTVYLKGVDDKYLVNRAFKEQRILLTRDTGLVERKYIPKYILIQSDDYLEQLKEVMKKCDIALDPKLIFSRCIVCNTEIIPVLKDEVKDKVPPYIYKTQEKFFSCPACNRVYWGGTHVDSVKNKLKELLPS